MIAKNEATKEKVWLQELRDYIANPDNSNPHVKFFLRVEDGDLLGIDTRFFITGDNSVKEETWSNISNKITKLSRGRIFVLNDGLFEHGIMDLKVNYIHKYCYTPDYIRVLDYISNEMLEEINGPH